MSERGEQLEGLPVVMFRVDNAEQFDVGAAKAAVRVGLCGPISDPHSGVQARLLNRGLLGPEPPAVQKVSKVPGQLPGVVVQAVRRGEPDHGDQRPMLGHEPAHRLIQGRDRLQRHRLLRRHDRDGRPARLQDVRGPGQGAEIVVEQPDQRGVPSAG